jgi:hypothetical protein
LSDLPSCESCGGPGFSIYSERKVWVLCEPCTDLWWSRPSSPPRGGIQSALRRANAARLPVTLTEEEWETVIEKFGDRCAYCGDAWSLVEHATPICRGGGTTIQNCLPACGRCNTKKGTLTIEEISIKWRSNYYWGNDSRRTSVPFIDAALAWLRECGREAFEQMPEVEDVK